MGTHPFKILIADRNPHVGEFLQREFKNAGYAAEVARDGRQVLSMSEGDSCPELLILDLDMPYVSGLSILEKLLNRVPPIPVVVHTFLTDDARQPVVMRAAGFCEKKGNNVDGLKATVEEVLQKWYPQRFSNAFRPGEKQKEHSG